MAAVTEFKWWSLHLTVLFSATAECEKLHQLSAREAINPEDLRGRSDARHRGDTWSFYCSQSHNKPKTSSECWRLIGGAYANE